MRKKSKLSSVFIVFLSFLTVFLSSCGFEDEYNPEVTSRPPLNTVSVETDGSQTESDDLLKNIEGCDYDGRSFVIVTTSSEYLSKSKNDSLVDNAVEKRNKAVEEKFGVKIEIKVESPATLVAKGENAVKNGEHYADLIIAPSNVLAELYSKGCLANINTLPYIEKDAEHIDLELWNASALNGKLYMLFGALTQTNYSPWCVFYNETILSKTGVDPTALYKNGEWTWENFLKCAEKSDNFAESGFITTATKESFFNILWQTTGKKFFEGCSDSPLKLPKIDGGKEILSEMKKIMNSVSYNNSVYGTEALDAFIGGHTGMLLCKRDAVYKICNSNMNWKAVPMPKYAAESQHYSPIDGDAVAASVLLNCDSEFSGRVLNGLIAATKLTVDESIEKNELYYYWKDNAEALSMLEMKKYIYLDIATIYAPYVGDIAVVTTSEIKNAYDTGITPFNFYHSTKQQFEIYAAAAFG